MRKYFIMLSMAASIYAVDVSFSQESASSSAKKPLVAAGILKPLNSLIGEWRGVGQPRRGSRTGAWIETARCVWDFSESNPAVIFKSEGGKQFQTLVLKSDHEAGVVVLKQTTEDGVRLYHGTMPSKWPGKIVLESQPDAHGKTFRCTIQQLKDIRATILIEHRTSPTGSFRRIAEVGYTRSGAKLAVAGGNQRKCVVTGGLGTIPVTYEGKTYYVCCSGCLQAFNESPAAIVAEYKASLKTSTKK